MCTIYSAFQLFRKSTVLLMIYIGLGSNLPSKAGAPLNTVKAALKLMPQFGIKVVKVSPWYESAPVPASDQPWFINGVAEIETDHSPEKLLDNLFAIEREFGRQRGELNAARPLDLDLLDYKGMVLKEGLILPHPRLHERAFVLYPLRDIAPDWVHPVLGLGIQALFAQFGGSERIRKYAEISLDEAHEP